MELPFFFRRRADCIFRNNFLVCLSPCIELQTLKKLVYFLNSGDWRYGQIPQVKAKRAKLL